MSDNNALRDLKEKLEPLVKVLQISNVNHKPHLFMIGPRHISFASDHYGGIIGNACLEDKNFPTCSHRDCTLSYKEHTYDKVVFIQLTKNTEEEELRTALLSVAGIMEANKIDGFTFVDTPEKFRIIPPKSKTENHEQK